MEDFIKKTRTTVYGINLFAVAIVLVIAFLNKDIITNSCPMKVLYTAQIAAIISAAIIFLAGLLLSRKLFNDSKKQTDTDLRYKKWKQSKLTYQIIWGLGAIGTAIYFHLSKDYYSIYISIIFILLQSMFVPGKEKSVDELS